MCSTMFEAFSLALQIELEDRIIIRQQQHTENHYRYIHHTYLGEGRGERDLTYTTSGIIEPKYPQQTLVKRVSRPKFPTWLPGAKYDPIPYIIHQHIKEDPDQENEEIYYAYLLFVRLSIQSTLWRIKSNSARISWTISTADCLASSWKNLRTYNAPTALAKLPLAAPTQVLHLN